MSPLRVPVFGAALGLLGAVLAGSVLLPWYSADLPDRSLTAAGVEASGELWLVPLLGGAILIAGIAVVARVGPVAREWAGSVAFAAGALAAGLAVRSAYFIPLEVTVSDRDGTASTDVAPETLPLSALTIAAALAAALVGAVVRHAARREGSRA
jgi:hypothetical protein